MSKAAEIVRVVAAIDAAIQKDWEAAKAALGTADGKIAERLGELIADLQRREAARRHALGAVRHEMGNALAIARVNLEGVADGVLPATPERIEAILSSLAAASRQLEELQSDQSA